MQLKLAAVAVALMLVATGAATAMPGNAPDDAQADDHANADDHAQAAEDADNSSEADADAADVNETATDADEKPDANATQGPPASVPASDKAESAANASDQRGPPVELPSQVPDFVSEIHNAITDHLSESLPGENLGQQIGDLLPGGNGATGNMPTDSTSGQ